MKRFLKEWKPKNIKEMDKYEKADFLNDLLSDLVTGYLLKGHKTDLTEVFNAVYDKKFVKSLSFMVKNEEDFGYIDKNVVIVLVDAIRNSVKKNINDPELDEKMYKIITKLCKKKYKKLVKIGINSELAEELAAILPSSDEDYITVKNIHVYIRKALNTLYRAAKENPDEQLYVPETLESVFKVLFGKEYMDIVVKSILLENRERIKQFKENELTVWNTLTTFAVDYLEDMKKNDLDELLKSYLTLKKKLNAVGRISLESLVKEDYPKIHKSLKRLSQN